MSGPSVLFRDPLHILGAGSIGLLWAASIRSAIPDYPVTLLLREHYKKQLADKDSIEIAWSRPQAPEAKVNLPIQFLNDQQEPISNLIVATKSYQAKTAVESIRDRLDPASSKIIVLCNGALSVREDLSSSGAASGIPLVLATTTHGAYQEHNKSHLVHAGVGKTFIEDYPGIGGMAELWNSASLNCQVLSSNEMESLLWEKLAANCVINPLTALFKCTNGELLMEPAFPQLEEEILGELAQVARAQHQQGVTEESLRSFVAQVIHDTMDNKSSMYQDVIKKQPTEIDHLNGYVVRMGRPLNVECPANDDVVQRIKEIESKRAV